MCIRFEIKALAELWYCTLLAAITMSPGFYALAVKEPKLSLASWVSKFPRLPCKELVGKLAAKLLKGLPR